MAGSADGSDSPGIGPSRDGLANNFLVGKQQETIIQVQFDSLATDVGNTNDTSVLRKGLVVAKLDADGLWLEYDNAGSPGQDTALGILNRDTNLKDRLGNVQDVLAPVVISTAHVDDTKLFGLDAAAETDLEKHITFEKNY